MVRLQLELAAYRERPDTGRSGLREREREKGLLVVLSVAERNRDRHFSMLSSNFL